MTVPGSSLGTEIWESSSQGKSWALGLNCLAQGCPLGPGSLLGSILLWGFECPCGFLGSLPPLQSPSVPCNRIPTPAGVAPGQK